MCVCMHAYPCVMLKCTYACLPLRTEMYALAYLCTVQCMLAYLCAVEQFKAVEASPSVAVVWVNLDRAVEPLARLGCLPLRPEQPATSMRY